jgi:hypothetical protein
MILLSDSRESFALVPDATFPGFVRRRLFVATGVENIQASAFRTVFMGSFCNLADMLASSFAFL